MKSIKTVCLTCIFLLFASCSQRITDFTIISSKNVDLSRGTEFKRGKDRVVGKDIKHVIMTIPTGVPDMKQAMDKAIESTPAAVALVDGVVHLHWWYIPLIYGRQWYEVEGTPLIDPKLQKDFAATH